MYCKCISWCVTFNILWTIYCYIPDSITKKLFRQLKICLNKFLTFQSLLYKHCKYLGCQANSTQKGNNEKLVSMELTWWISWHLSSVQQTIMLTKCVGSHDVVKWGCAPKGLFLTYKTEIQQHTITESFFNP